MRQQKFLAGKKKKKKEKKEREEKRREKRREREKKVLGLGAGAGAAYRGVHTARVDQSSDATFLSGALSRTY